MGWVCNVLVACVWLRIDDRRNVDGKHWHILEDSWCCSKFKDISVTRLITPIIISDRVRNFWSSWYFPKIGSRDIKQISSSISLSWRFSSFSNSRSCSAYPFPCFLLLIILVVSRLVLKIVVLSWTFYIWFVIPCSVNFLQHWLVNWDC